MTLLFSVSVSLTAPDVARAVTMLRTAADELAAGYNSVDWESDGYSGRLTATARDLSRSPPRFPPGSFAANERQQLVTALCELRGNKLAAAKRLRIGRQTIYNKIKFYQITPAETASLPLPNPPTAETLPAPPVTDSVTDSPP